MANNIPNPDNMTDAEAAAIRARLAALEDEDGSLHYSVVVADARRDPTSPLHRYLEWDDAAAAEIGRLYQIRRVVKAVEDIEGEANG